MNTFLCAVCRRVLAPEEWQSSITCGCAQRYALRWEELSLLTFPWTRRFLVEVEPWPRGAEPPCQD